MVNIQKNNKNGQKLETKIITSQVDIFIGGRNVNIRVQPPDEN
jgi:hypothetical protein